MDGADDQNGKAGKEADLSEKPGEGD